jgi:lipopolysaccharide biosynthesis protein
VNDSLQNLDVVQNRANPSARLIAYYLPQFHPIPENDAWWGKGFTEWTNVTKAKPLFRGHQQPRLPTDLGFYDLRLAESREAQAQIARECGVEGFCYWHYWFGNERRILERPFEEARSSGKPDFPFCLSWANQSWSGIWHGNPKHTLIEQLYPGRDDERAHFECVRKAFEDRRYIKVDGRPLFSIYMPHDLPDPTAFVEHWRELALKAGFPGIYLVAITNEPDTSGLSAFDAITPNGPGDFFVSGETKLSEGIKRIKRRISKNLHADNIWRRYIEGGPRRFQYEELVKHGLISSRFSARFIPCVVPNWDNTPRSKHRGVVVEGSSPDQFKNYLAAVCSLVSNRPPNDRIVFLKAWNEWAEGNYVEPDSLFGRGYLEAIKSALFEPQTQDRHDGSNSFTVADHRLRRTR